MPWPLSTSYPFTHPRQLSSFLGHRTAGLGEAQRVFCCPLVPLHFSQCRDFPIWWVLVEYPHIPDPELSLWGSRRKTRRWSCPHCKRVSKRVSWVRGGRPRFGAVYFWDSPLLPGEWELIDLPLGWAEGQHLT